MSVVPLADKLRPTNFDEYVGQEHLTAEGRLFRKSVEEGSLSSCIFWGPPGCGKTSLANVIANVTKKNFVHFSAVLQGVKAVIRQLRRVRMPVNAEEPAVMFGIGLHSTGLNEMAKQAITQFGFEPGTLGRHDALGVSDTHKIFYACRIHREGASVLTAVYQFLQFARTTDATDKLNPVARPGIGHFKERG